MHSGFQVSVFSLSLSLMLLPQRMYLIKPEGKDWIHMVVQQQYFPTEHIIKGLLVNLIGSASSD